MEPKDSKSPHVEVILGQLNPIKTLTEYLFKIRINVIFHVSQVVKDLYLFGASNSNLKTDKINCCRSHSTADLAHLF
jgi:hypothetical protein